MMLLGASVISSANNIPFLASNALMTNKLKMVLNLPGQEAYLGLLDTAVPICKVAGHLALDISKFPSQASKSDMWKHYRNMCLEPHADMDLMYVSPDGSSIQQFAQHRHLDEQGRSTTMVVRMEEDGVALSRSRAHSPRQHGPGGADWNSPPEVVGSPGPRRHGCHGSDSPEVQGTMPARDDAEVRQQTRQLREVRPLRKEVEMVTRGRKVDRPSSSKAALAAIALIINGIFVPGQSPQAELGFGDAFTEHRSEANKFDIHEPGQVHASTTGGKTERQDIQQTFSSFATGRGDRGRQLGVRLGSGGRMKHGTKTWLTSHLRSMGRIYTHEIDAYDSLITYAEKQTNGPEIDLMEVFAGSANLTFRAPLHGLSALEPIDWTINLDLRNPKDQKILWSAIHRFKPLVVTVAWPCTYWSLFNQNMNYSWRMEELAELRDYDRPLVKLGADIMKHQDGQGRFFVGENPLPSAIWSEDDVQEVMNLPGTMTTKCEAGAYGAETKDGYPVIKAHRWVTNSVEIARELQRKLTPEQKLYTKPIEGADTAASGCYCDGLADAILRGVAKEAQRRDPSRFVKANKVYCMHPSTDEQQWQEVMNELERRFANTHKKPFPLGQGDPLYKVVEQLIPRKLERIQASWTPAARRFPTDIAYTHRGSVLLLNNGKITIEQEDLSQVTYPKQRYAEPVRIGLHFFGAAPDDELPGNPPPGDEDERRRVPGMSTEIWFEGAGNTLKPELKKSVARLHTNMGHPPKEELTRMLAASNTLSASVL